MNNRKTINSRGVNPRLITRQVIFEPVTLTKEVNGQDVVIPNPRYFGVGTKRIIYHRKTL